MWIFWALWCEVGAALKITFIQFVRLNVNIWGMDAGRQHSAIKHQLTRFSYRWTDWNIDPVQFDRLFKIIFILISCKLIPQVRAVVFVYLFFHVWPYKIIRCISERLSWSQSPERYPETTCVGWTVSWFWLEADRFCWRLFVPAGCSCSKRPSVWTCLYCCFCWIQLVQNVF